MLMSGSGCRHTGTPAMFTSPRAQVFPVLPLRDIVVFPHMIVPLFVGREKSVRALEDVMKDDKQILLVAQKNAGQDNPEAGYIHEIGREACRERVCQYV